MNDSIGQRKLRCTKYDALNRLTSATVSTSVAPIKTFAYDSIGNMLSKSDVGTYGYAPPGSPLPHAVSSISGTVLSTTFTYDPNGNQTSGLGRSITWKSYNKPSAITQGARSISFFDDAEHQRFKQISPEGTTLYIGGFGVLAELFIAPGGNRWTDYLTVGNVKVGARSLILATSTVLTRYFQTDSLGSVAVITDESAVVVERLSYDAWGKRRFPNAADDTAGVVSSQTTRGFTGEEELSIANLVHLNGRVYDSFLGRMTSADPTVTDPLNPQGWNRYSYVGNDPLAFTDPNGFSWLSDFFSSVVNFFRSNPIVQAILNIALAATLMALPFVGEIIAAVGFSGALASALTAGVTAGLSSAIVNGLSGGNLGTMLRAGLIAGVTAIGFNLAGGASSALASGGDAAGAYAFNVAAHAGVGCVSAVASGGECGPGALSAGISAAAGPFIPRTDMLSGAAIRAIIGGVSSVAGGGKFENGAVTGAFGYLFNDAMHSGSSDGRGFWGELGNLLSGNHDYTGGPNVICPASWSCSAELVGGVYSQVRNGIPGNTSDALIVSGQTYTVYQNGLPVGQVQSYVGGDGLTVANVTDPGHILFDGWANRNAYEVNGAWYSVTHGSGTNYYGGAFMAAANQAFGPGIFNAMDKSIASQLYTATHH